MKKSMLCAGLMTILGTTAYAQDSNKPTKANKTNTTQTTPTLANKQKKQNLTTAFPAGTSMLTQQGAQTATSDAIKTPTVPSTQTPTTQDVQTTATPVKPPQPLNCNYHISAQTTHIEQAIIMKWAQKAAEQSFDFNPNLIDKQLLDLKSCYTDQGWQGFNDALQKSGNLNAIKSQHLVVSSIVNGEGKVIEIKDNQWKVTLPMQVVYQNDKEKLTQPLLVDLVVGRKISGDLGIMQMIAIPRQANTTSNVNGASQAETPAISNAQPKQP